MAWTTPKTYTVGEVLTAATMNTHVRDNLNALNQAVQVHISANQNHTASGSFQTLTWDTEDFDTNTLHDNVTNNSRLIAAMAGDYWVYGQVTFNAVAGVVGVSVKKNGATVFDNRVQSANSFGNGAEIGVGVALSATDYVELAALQSSGGTLAMLGGSGGTSCFFGMKLIGV